MCEECEAAAEPLRETYLARRARMAQTWRRPGGPPRRWSVDAAAPAAALPADAGPKLTAAE